MTTLQQKLAQQEAELNRTKERIRKLENGQKIITGGMMLSIAKKVGNILISKTLELSRVLLSFIMTTSSSLVIIYA